MVELVYAPYLADYGYALSSIGTLSALLAIFRLLSRVPTGAAYAPGRVRRQLAFWLLAFGLSTAGFAFARGELLVVIAVTVVHGYAFGALGTLNLAVIIDLTGGRRAGSVMGLFTAALSIGYALGAFVGGAVGDRYGLDATFLLGGGLLVVAILGVAGLPAFTGAPHPLDRGVGLRGLLAAHARLDARVWLAFVIALYINLLSDAVDRFFPLYALGIGLPLSSSGALKGLKSGAATLTGFVSGGLFRFVDYRAVNFWGVLVFGAVAFAIPLASGFAALAMLFLVTGATRSLLRVTSSASVAELRNEGKDVGLASGVYSAGLDLGAMVGPAVGGFLGQGFGLAAMFQIVALGSLVLYFAVALATAQGRAALALHRRA